MPIPEIRTDLFWAAAVEQVFIDEQCESDRVRHPKMVAPPRSFQANRLVGTKCLGSSVAKGTVCGLVCSVIGCSVRKTSRWFMR
jgi:hypothetical protein